LSGNENVKNKRGHNSGVYMLNCPIIELDRSYVLLKAVTKSH